MLLRTCRLLTVVLCVMHTGAAESADQNLARIQQAVQNGQLEAAQRELQTLIRQVPGDARIYNLLGVVHARRNEFTPAETNFRRAIQLSNQFTAAYMNLGRLYQEHADGPAIMRKAVRTYERLLAFAPNDVEANYQAALLLMRLGDFSGSLQHLSRLPPDAKGRAAALALYWADYALAGDEALARTAEAKLGAASDLTEADVLLVIDVLDHNKASGLATRLLDRLRERDLLSAPGILALARIAYRAGDLERALGYVAQARDLQPNNAVIHFLFGLICIDLKLPPEAAQSLQEAVRLDPANPHYNYALGAVLLQQRNTEEAAACFRKYVSARRDDPRGHFALGVAYFDGYRLDLAKKELEFAAARAETQAGANLYLARLELRQDNSSETAGVLLQKAIQANPSAPEPLAELGLLQIRRNQYTAAAATLNKAITISPDHYRSNLNLLLLYQRTKDPRAEDQEHRVAELRKAGEERERMLLRSLDIRPY